MTEIKKPSQIYLMQENIQKMERKTLLSWSSGKDSAWALHVLRQQPDIDVVGLFCTVNAEFNRVAMHAVRVGLLQEQAKSVGLPLYMIQIPYPCSNLEYEAAMNSFIDEAKQRQIECFAFGDLFLEDVRRYREDCLKGTGITPIFPIWSMPTRELSRMMVGSGLRARITCVDPKQLSGEFVGREYDESFLEDIPADVDPCGENGEFHSFAFDGPMFKTPIEVSLGEIALRDGFVFADLLPCGASNPESNYC
jgi:uncharacterized protein (TIGR00290 family)